MRVHHLPRSNPAFPAAGAYAGWCGDGIGCRPAMYRSRFRFCLSRCGVWRMLSFPFFFGCYPANRSGAGGDLLLICRIDSWWIACREGEDHGRFNKTACRISCLANRRWFHLPLADRGGEGRKWCLGLARWFLLHLCAPHAVVLHIAVIYGQKGGRSSTSIGGLLDPAPVLGDEMQPRANNNL